MTVSPKEYNRCVNEYADGLYRFALKIMDEVEMAKDIIQESFEKLWINRKAVELSKAKSYLFTVAYHLMMDTKRKHKLQNKYESTGFDYVNNEQYSDLNEVLHRAAERLPDIQRSVLLLRDYEGYSYEEIGQITGLNLSQVKVYIHRARLQMKLYIGSIDAVI
ncbi:MAG: RNA polymerase sigma factor [Prevotellaceae bacterium]|jgi:RNA polymerase sigma-70 factor (ECF subfamily)|nr:RNA polymerase sigma factor [Prevotellaceae bacterium]